MFKSPLSKYEKADRLSQLVIGAAIEVHKVLGAGLIESIYQKCIMHELQLRRIPFASEIRIPVRYKGITFEENLRLDLYVDESLIVELKAVESILPVHKAQLLSYMKLLICRSDF